MISKLERKFGKYAIPNLSLYLVIGYAIGYFISVLSPSLYSMLTFNPYAIMHGQIWRIVTWVLTLPGNDNILGIFIMIFFYYSIGTTLERTWGTFRYNLYLFSGYLFTMVGGVIFYVIMGLLNAEAGGDLVWQMMGSVVGLYTSTYYINMSIFLAIAITYPEMEVLLYFIIPLKIKWLSYLYGAYIIYNLIVSPWIIRVMIIMSLLNFIIFFFATRNYNRANPREINRKRTYRKKVYEAQQNATYSNGARHKCAICGRTELDNPDLTFRYCSKCTGGKEYCQDHLFTHEHK